MSLFRIKFSAPTLKARWDTSLFPGSNVPTAGRITANKKGLIATSERVMRFEPQQEWVPAHGKTTFAWDVIESFYIDAPKGSLVIHAVPMLGHLFVAEIPGPTERDRWVRCLRRWGVPGGD